MFCPKCGTKNPKDGKFCRKCGTDLSTVSDAIGGNLPINQRYNTDKHKKRKASWETAMSKFFMGLAFLVVAIILGVTGAAGGKAWWFWMLIPAFGMIGAGVAQIIQLKEYKQYVEKDLIDDTKQIENQQHQALPSTQTEYVENFPATKYQTGDLVPPSVVENTTRHLEMNAEGETMALPKDKLT